MTAMGELCAVTSHSTLLPVTAALYTRMVPRVLEEGSAKRQGSKQVLKAQQPCNCRQTGVGSLQPRYKQKYSG